MSASDDRPYAVGKGKPPLSGRWGPGQSGNPNGSSKKVRRRKDKSVAGRLRAIANEKIMLPESGEEVSIADLVLKRHGVTQHVAFPSREIAAPALAPLHIPVPNARKDEHGERHILEWHARFVPRSRHLLLILDLG